MTLVPTTETFDIMAHAKHVQRKQSYRRYANLGAGLLLLAAAWPSRLPWRLLLAALGSGLVVRGVTDHTLRDNVKRLKARRDEHRHWRSEDVDLDQVDEASWESFPASDPPSFTSR